MKDVIWKVTGINRPVWHLFECWTDKVRLSDKEYIRSTIPLCAESPESIVFRPDGIYCRVCVGIEGAVV